MFDTILVEMLYYILKNFKDDFSQIWKSFFFSSFLLTLARLHCSILTIGNFTRAVSSRGNRRIIYPRFYCCIAGHSFSRSRYRKALRLAFTTNEPCSRSRNKYRFARHSRYNCDDTTFLRD